MRYSTCLVAFLLTFASKVHAEKLEFDYRLSPALAKVLGSGDADMLDYSNTNPRRLVNIIAVKGKSARKWQEALEIISTFRPADINSVSEWMASLERQEKANCPNAAFTVLNADENSTTFEMRAENCPKARAKFAYYRMVAGKNTWFQLSVLAKEPLTDKQRQEWLALLASAHLS